MNQDYNLKINVILLSKYDEIIFRIIISAISVVITAYLLPGIHVKDLLTSLIVAVVLAMLNGIVRPILNYFYHPGYYLNTWILFIGNKCAYDHFGRKYCSRLSGGWFLVGAAFQHYFVVDYFFIRYRTKR